jgi:hypothetical protein
MLRRFKQLFPDCNFHLMCKQYGDAPEVLQEKLDTVVDIITECTTLFVEAIVIFYSI